jgi:hypothetical protein
VRERERVSVLMSCFSLILEVLNSNPREEENIRGLSLAFYFGGFFYSNETNRKNNNIREGLPT